MWVIVYSHNVATLSCDVVVTLFCDVVVTLFCDVVLTLYYDVMVTLSCDVESLCIVTSSYIVTSWSPVL